jgi:hypothetical protein
MVKQSTFLVWLFILTTLPGCRDPLPCSDCDLADDDSASDLPSPADLPCGGADLNSDPNNCGECGSGCALKGEGTEWEAGGCVDGECLPTWGTCEVHDEANPKTCAEKCLGGTTCQANGCGGHTALFFVTFPFNPMCWENDPYEVFDDGCDEPLTAPYDDPNVGIMVQCCCL